jgi:hypothetical protein
MEFGGRINRELACVQHHTRRLTAGESMTSVPKWQSLLVQPAPGLIRGPPYAKKARTPASSAVGAPPPPRGAPPQRFPVSYPLVSGSARPRAAKLSFRGPCLSRVVIIF